MDDLISRKEAIDWIKGWFETDKHYHPYSKGKTIPTCEVMDILERVPSAQPQRNKGKWVTISDGYVDVVKCDQCGKMTDDISNYCPNCGAEMENGNGKTD